MSTDPNLMAAMLQGDQGAVWPFLKGLGKGMVWDPIKGAYTAASQLQGDPAAELSGDPSSFHPLQTVQGWASAAGDKLQSVAADPAGALGRAASSIWSGLTAGPESAGETIGSFVGPGDVVNGLRAFGKGSAIPKSDIWVTKDSPMYDRNIAARAKERTLEGDDPRHIFRDTETPEAGPGSGYWMPPPQVGQEDPLLWVSDEGAKFNPGTLRDIRNEAPAQLEHFRNQVARGTEGLWKTETDPYGVPVRRFQVPLDPSDRADLLKNMSRPQNFNDDIPQSDLFRWDHRYAPSVPVEPKEIGTWARDALTDPGNSNPRTFTYGEVLDHPRLYEAAPGLRDTPITVLPWQQNYRGQYNLGEGSVNLGNTLGRGNDTPGVRNTLLHEAQHAIANAGGLPQGMGGGLTRAWDDRFHQLLSMDTEAIARGDHNARILGDHEVAFAQDLRHKIADARTTTSGGLYKLPEGNDSLGYANNFGEAIARQPGDVLAARDYQRKEQIPVIAGPLDVWGTPPGKGWPSTMNDPSQMVMRGSSARMYDPRASQWPGLRSVVTHEFDPVDRPLFDPPRTPATPEQLALGLRRAGAKTPQAGEQLSLGLRRPPKRREAQ